MPLHMSVMNQPTKYKWLVILDMVRLNSNALKIQDYYK